MNPPALSSVQTTLNICKVVIVTRSLDLVFEIRNNIRKIRYLSLFIYSTVSLTD